MLEPRLITSELVESEAELAERPFRLVRLRQRDGGVPAGLERVLPRREPVDRGVVLLDVEQRAGRTMGGEA